MCTPHCLSTVMKTPGSGMLAWRPGMRESLRGPCLAAFPSIPEPWGCRVPQEMPGGSLEREPETTLPALRAW